MQSFVLALGLLAAGVAATSNVKGRVQIRGAQHLAAERVKNSTQVVTEMGMQLKDGERAKADNFFNFLVDHKGPAPDKAQFLAECLEHLHDFTHALDHSYSDVQLTTMLKHACDKFPGHDGLNFDHQEGCDDFSKRLLEARHHELENNGEIKEYQAMCKHYYQTEVCARHDCEEETGKKKEGKKTEGVVGKMKAAAEEVEEEVEEALAIPSKCWLLLIAFLISCCLGGYGAHKRHITGIIAVVVFVVSFVYICFFTNLMNRFFHSWAMSWTCWFLCLFVVVQGITYLAYFITMGLVKAGIIKQEGIKSHF